MKDFSLFILRSPRRCLGIITIISLVSFMISSTSSTKVEPLVVSTNILDDSDPSNGGKEYFIGPCLVANNTCPDQEVTFFLYTARNPESGQKVFVDKSGSNLAETNFDAARSTKIIVHGYNSDMELGSLVDIKREYLKKGQYNVIAVDWHRLAVAPCYPIAVYNVRHVGECLGQLIERLWEYGTEDVHVIGFSLGAHVPAFSANYLQPRKISRITGLDPAMPLFITVSKSEKLDAGDANFVDVLHTNAFVQGKIEPSGHVDFYMNGGISQPGCWERRNNPFGCDHHRSNQYFAESINSKDGFWGWSCAGFFHYLIGLCPPRYPAAIAGDPANDQHKGFYIVKTNSKSPFAKGMFSIDQQDVNFL